MARIKINVVPPEKTHVGAPSWVREQWVGIILPLLEKAPLIIYGVGAIGGKPESERCVVDTAVAIQKLREKSPEAAKWWGNNFSFDGPHGLSRLVFPREVCELLP